MDNGSEQKTDCQSLNFMALESLKRIEMGQSHQSSRLTVIESSINNHMSTVAANTTSMTNSLSTMAGYLEGIQNTNTSLMKSSRWSVPLIAVLLIMAVFLFRELGEGSSAKFGDFFEIQNGHSQKKPERMPNDNKTME